MSNIVKPVVFLSYSHDSDAHRQRVLELSERLRTDGITTILDRYMNTGSPPQGWPRWMMDEIDAATHVLCICTENYGRRFRGMEVVGKGKGANWEGAVITQLLYDAHGKSNKFVAVVFTPDEEQSIPTPLRGHTFYILESDAGYRSLYDALLGQSGISPGKVGELKQKPRATAKPLAFSQVGDSAVAVPSNRPSARKATKHQTQSSVQVSGNHNIVGSGNIVSINSRDVKRVVVQTGEGAIDATQKAELKALVEEWVENRNVVRKNDLSFGGAWSALNAHFGVNSYHEIPMESFGAARAWLKRQLAIIDTMPSAKRKIANWRTTRIRGIKAASKNQLKDEHAYLAYIEKNFARQSLADLDDDQLQKAYQYVMGRKSRSR